MHSTLESLAIANARTLRTGTKAQRTSIRCRDALPNGDTRCKNNPQLPAYTTQREGLDGTDDNTWITFCPKFFASNDVPNLADLTKNPKKSSELYTLRTREHIIAHEFMHVKRYGYRNFIDDLHDPRVDGPIYGGSRCADFGWLFSKDSPSTVTVLQEVNGEQFFPPPLKAGSGALASGSVEFFRAQSSSCGKIEKGHLPFLADLRAHTTLI